MTERDNKGRFIKGSSGNPTGRAPRKREERYYEILISTVTFDDWKDIVKKAADQAKRGDAVARKWLSDYIVGVPEQNYSGDVRILFEYVGDSDGDEQPENDTD